jgi:hypothetical protein
VEKSYRVLLKESEIRTEKLKEQLARTNMAEHEVEKIKTGCEYWRRRCLDAEEQVATHENVLEIARELVDYETRTFSRSKYVKKLKRALIELEGVKA